MDAYSQDLRDRVLRAWERGERPPAIADRFEVSRVWVSQVRNRLTQTGQRSSLPIGGHRRARVVGMEATLRTWLKETSDLTLAELCTRRAAHGIASKIAPTCKPPGVSGRPPNQLGTSRRWSFWMKRGRRRTWHGATDAPRAAHAALPPCLTAIGTPPPSSPGGVRRTSRHRWWRTAP